VLFDAGGTLVHPDWNRIARVARAETGREFTHAEMRRTLYEALRAVDARLSEEQARAAAHTRQPGWLFRDMFCALGVDEEACERMAQPMLALHNERHLWCVPDSDAPRVIADLKRAGLRVGVISNTEDGRARETVEEVVGQLDLLVDSHLVGLRKPDAAIFHHALEELKVAAREAVYVGDSYGHDVLGAQSAGLRAILLDPLDFYAESDCPRIHQLKELTEDAGC